MIASQKPVLSICAVRTGAGKSPASRRIASVLSDEGLRTVVVRHPMPYGDLTKQAVQRFASLQDMEKADCTIEEMEEYEPHIKVGRVVYAGVDYEAILRRAEDEADVILWEGGNNDLPFFVPDLEIVLADPHRVGDETTFFPGEANLLRADMIMLTKLDTAPEQKIEALRANIQTKNPSAVIIDSAMPVIIDEPAQIQGSRVLVVEDGPTLTHGGMTFGAGVLAAKKFGAAELVDPRPVAVGSIKETFNQYPHIGNLLPAMGYGSQQVQELGHTIEQVKCDLVVIATPVDLRRVIRIRQATCRVRYELQETGHPTLPEALKDFIEKAKRHA
jgi:predicted GTPase